ncbi:MAG: DUF459 domain-containing protein, partial [Rhizobiaceae bacterium]|nr:DUF459 domain-containing protein [Rhizobiaceae bacterium]
RLLGDQASPDITRLDTGGQPAAEQVSLPPEEMEKITRTQPMNLSDPDLDGGSQLLGGTPPPDSGTPSPRDLLVEKGQMAPAPTGRVDDYRLPVAASTNP